MASRSQGYVVPPGRIARTQTARTEVLETPQSGPDRLPDSTRKGLPVMVLHTSPRTCSAESCDRPVRRNNLCNMHSQRARRAGTRPCTIEGCTNGQYAKGVCNTHYLRIRKGIDLDAPLQVYKAPSLAARVWARLAVGNEGKPVTECWEWPGSRSEKGYGKVNHERKTTYPHIVTYKDAIGPIPDGLELDHLCNNPPCANPWHLEPVTPLENIRRRDLRRAA